jgi:uncharacterized protein (TIGR02246 family)
MPERDRERVAGILAAINDAWRTGPPHQVAAAIRPYFSDDAVIVAPNLARVARGGDAVAASYQEFVETTRVLRAMLGTPEIDVLGDVAVATVTWHMLYVFDGTETVDTGHDVYVLRRREGGWLVCWREVLSSPVRLDGAEAEPAGS